MAPLIVAPSVSAENELTGCASAALQRLFVQHAWVRTFCTSTVGLAPLTVTVSWSDPTAISALTGAVNPAFRMMPPRLTTLNPGSVNVTV